MQTTSPAIPKHIAIVMDGNNRYGKLHGLPAGQGHWWGKEALEPIVHHCRQIGVQVLTVFAFSSENWARLPEEIALLMALLEQSICEQIPMMNQHQVRLRFIGDRSALSNQLQQLMNDAEQKTAHFTAMTLVIAISYGGQWDIANAAKCLAEQVAYKTLAVEAINSELLGQFVALSDCPPVDMLIRTGGEWRISNFLLWQAAYAELFFSKTLWPAFGVDEFAAMIAEFGNRERRFGKSSPQDLPADSTNQRVDK